MKLLKSLSLILISTVFLTSGCALFRKKVTPPPVNPAALAQKLIETNEKTKAKTDNIIAKANDSKLIVEELKSETKYVSPKWDKLKLNLDGISSEAKEIQLVTNVNITYVMGAGQQYVDSIVTQREDWKKKYDEQLVAAQKEKEKREQIEKDMHSLGLGLMKWLGGLFILLGIVGGVFVSDMRGKFLTLAGCGILLLSVSVFLQINTWAVMLIGGLTVLGLVGYLAYELYRKRKEIFTKDTTIKEVISNVQEIKEVVPEAKEKIQEVLKKQTALTKSVVANVKENLK